MPFVFRGGTTFTVPVGEIPDRHELIRDYCQGRLDGDWAKLGKMFCAPVRLSRIITSDMLSSSQCCLPLPAPAPPFSYLTKKDHSNKPISYSIIAILKQNPWFNRDL